MSATLLLLLLTANGTAVSAQDTARTDTTRRARAGQLPLVADRTERFTVREGTWISLDVSPDGRTIVFDLLGDLYTIPIEGGAATRLTSGMAFDAQPRYSPDGRTIVFTSDRSGGENLWLIDADGRNPRALTRGDQNLYASPEWLPDGEYIVTSRTTGSLGSRYELYLYHRDGGSGLELTRGEDQMNAMGPALGRDSRYIWFARRTGGFSYNQIFPTWQLAIYDRQTSRYYGQTALWGSAMRPTLSPDGRWLVYASRLDTETSLRIRDLQSGDERILVRAVQRDDQESRYTRDLMPGMSFSPDSRFLFAAWGGRIRRITIPTGETTEIPFSVDVELELGPRVHFTSRISDSAITVRQIRSGALSPDGSRLAFTALDRLWLLDLPTDTAIHAVRNARRVSRDSIGEYSPAWSPDGRMLAWVTWHDTSGGHLWTLRLDQRNARPVRVSQVPAYYINVAFSPDGQRLLAVRGPRYHRIQEMGGPGLELVWMPVAGGAGETVTRVGRASLPHFVRGQPDRIWYYETDGLVSFRWDGTDRRRHVRITGYTNPAPGSQPTQASDIVMSPLGDRALAEVNSQLYLVAVPQIGEEPPSISVTNPSSASVPVRRLTRSSGEFARWAPDARTIHWSMGRWFFRYDIAVGDSVARLTRDTAATRDTARARNDTARVRNDTTVARRDTTRAPRYEGHRLEVVITAPRDIPRGSIVLRGARIITMRGDEVIEDGDIVVTDNRIAQVCTGRCSDPPRGARVIDVTGRTIMPGLVDIHAHLRPPFGVHRGQVWEYLANLAYGITTTRDPQTATTDVLSYGDLVETGALLGPRIFSTGPGYFWSDNPGSLEETREQLRRYSEYWQTGTIKQYMVGNRRQRQWAIQAAREQGLMPTTEGGLDFKMDLTLMIDGYPGLEHNLPITPIYEDVAQLAARSGITYTPTLLVAYGGPWTENLYYESVDIHADAKLRRFTPHDEIDARALRRPAWFHPSQYVHDRIARAAAQILRAGGRVGLGGHGQLQGLGVHWELWSIQSGGMSTHDALRVATISGAEAIGLAQDLGSLEPGKLADLIVLDRNPLQDIRNTNAIRYVMRNGRLYEADTLDEIAPNPRRLPRQWWMEER
ncbi:MAG TPA: amidohydrolase family protein [Gemmatimonadales bacterium]|nr:amidohydrolase family protein [Gemmatimonadales bacterium]